MAEALTKLEALLMRASRLPIELVRKIIEINRVWAAIIGQKYTRGGLPRLAWADLFTEQWKARGAGWMPRRPYLNEWVEDVLRTYRGHQFRMTMRGRIGGEGQDDYSPYNRMRRSP
eukprot:scaffold30435_cov129-Isochrysis_galbana.AAC.1